MKVITISREFGSGGRELGKRIAKQLAWQYYDREIITTVASNTKMNANYVAQALEQYAWQDMPLTFHQSIAGIALHSAHTDLLVEQKCVIEKIAQKGADCVIVGRNADVLLREHNPFNIFVCADLEAKVQRCIERAPENEDLTEKEIKRKMRRIDKNRAQTRELVTGSRWGVKENYHLTVNTSSWVIAELTPAVVEFAKSWYQRNQK